MSSKMPAQLGVVDVCELSRVCAAGTVGLRPTDGLIARNYSAPPIFTVEFRLGKQEHLLQVQVETDNGTKFDNRYPVVPPNWHGKLEVGAGSMLMTRGWSSTPAGTGAGVEAYVAGSAS